MSGKKAVTKVSAKLKVVEAIRKHLMLSPEEYRLLVLHVVRDHIAEKRRRVPGDEDERKAA